MDAGQWPQEVKLVKVPMEGSRPIIERKPRPQNDQALNCPRCNSTNTKFCYYNNYSLSQPRYFCKTCRRYWTDGGSLRNVPVGGGSRKNKRSSTSSSSSSIQTTSSNKKLADLTTSAPTPTGFPLSLPSQNPKIHQDQDLNLAYPPPPGPLLPSDHHHPDYTNLSKFIEVPFSTNGSDQLNPVTNLSTSSSSSSMELLKQGMSSRELGSFMSMPLPNPSTLLYSTALPDLPEFKSTLSFSTEGFGSEYGTSTSANIGQGLQETTGARVLFPLEELKPQRGPGTSTTSGYDRNRSTTTTPPSHDQGYWNGMLGGGGSW